MAPAEAALAECDGGEVWQGTCSDNDGDHVDIYGSDGDDGGGSGGGNGGGGGGGPSDPPPPPPEDCEVVRINGEDNAEILVCRPLDDDEGGRGGEGADPIRIEDVASFRPDPPHALMEPDGWSVVGLPANFYSDAHRNIDPGQLLGRSTDVRFTPIGYRWSYGDGDERITDRRGSTWRAQGADEFDRTATSHAYDNTGAYVVRLTVEYAAEYRFSGGSWIPVLGTLSVPANELEVVIGTAKTVLVDDDCVAAPAGPGC